jgi:membrane fusion protein, multidrug efflux system
MVGRPLFPSRWALAATAAALVMSGCDRATPGASGGAPAPREVEIVQIRAADLPVSFEFVGRTESSQRVEIRARVSGFLDEIAYTEGAAVEEGAVLFRLDPAPFESRLRRARAELVQQEARLENAEALLARIEPLAEMEAVAAKELDDARGRVREAAAAVEAVGTRIDDAELQLSYTTISSPVGGLTGSAREREGAYISGVTGPLTYVARIDPMWVEFSVTETRLLRGARTRAQGAVRYPEDDAFEVAIDLVDGSRHPYTGRISFTDATVSDQTGAVLFRAEIPNPERTLRPGQYVRVTLGGAVRPDALAAPQRAVREGPRGPYVWVVSESGVAEQRPVELGPWRGDAWVIERGLRRGDRVIVSGTMALAPGTPVTITRILEPDELPGDGSEGSAS